MVKTKILQNHILSYDLNNACEKLFELHDLLISVSVTFSLSCVAKACIATREMSRYLIYRFLTFKI